ncbi:DNA-primase RepB domain-containing protein [Holophaga foetida]|uniref:DNA-primase RepB domain-containing protein n=1 Tax=Holophaga foetida TaxID=35839 RepID=UPI0002473B4E|nr:DNA-primase RepB domain-containing protein [Holophaga foetida]
MTGLRERLVREALPFLACLEECAPEDAWLRPQHWQTFDEDKTRKDGSLAKHWPQDLDGAAAELERLNQAGAGIFLTVNRTDGRGRTKAHIQALRGWHADLDTKDASEPFDLARVPLPPTMAVQTPGGWHLYWLPHEPMPCPEEARRLEHEAELRGLQAALSIFGADRAACEVARVLRLPGFEHRKDQPLPVRLVLVDGPRYSREEIREAFPPQEKAQRARKEPQAQEPKAQPSSTRRTAPDSDQVRRYLDTLEPSIQGQDGSHALFTAALKITDGYDLTNGHAVDFLERFYNPRCQPLWSTAEIQRAVDRAAPLCQDRGHLLREGPRLSPGSPSSADNQAAPAPAGAPPAPKAPKASQATIALRLAASAGAVAWLDDADTAFITVPVEDHVEHYRLRADPGSPAGRWLGGLFYRSERRALGSSAMKDALANLVAEASASKRVFPTARRVARFEGRVFLDLCTPSWEVAEIAPQAWRIIPAASSPIRFTRSPGMMALPVPVRGGQVEALRPFFNCDEDSFRMVVAWALAAISAGREYPVLVFGGEPGAAKSTATRYARALIDPNVAPLRKVPKEEKDLFIAAKNAHVLTFDNLSSPPEWLPDALCALALDTGYACRALYTDDDEMVFRVAAPIILNGISEQLTRSDLADRAFSVTLHRIDPERMRARDEMDADFQEALPGVLGALLDVLASALDRLPTVALDRLPRMAQSAKLMAAAEPALGWEPGTFARISDQARESVAANVAEGDPLAIALAELVQHRAGFWSFTGTASELRRLIEKRPSTIPTGMVWPPAANHLSQRLRRIAPVLRLQGWEVNPDGRDGSKKNGRMLHLAYPAPEPSDDHSDDPACRTITENEPSEAKPAPALNFGQSDGRTITNPETLFTGVL